MPNFNFLVLKGGGEGGEGIKLKIKENRQKQLFWFVRGCDEAEKSKPSKGISRNYIEFTKCKLSIMDNV